MSEAPDQPMVRRAAFRMAPATRQQFLAVLAYLDERHWAIDRDMYRLDPAEIAALARLIERNGDGANGGTVSATARDLLTLQYALDAAGTYANRRGQPEVTGVGNDELAALMKWAEDAHRWFHPSTQEDT